MGKRTAYGRDFEFGDDVSVAEQDTRIRNWMQLHAPDELRSGSAPASTPSPAPTPDPPRSSGPDEPRSGWGNVKALWSDPAKFWSEGKGKAAARDTGNYVRTVAQGALPFSDEGIASIRSLMGTDYDTALADERARLKEFGDQHGELAKTLVELGGAAATIPLTMGGGMLLQGARALPYAGAAINALGRGASAIGNIASKAPLAPSLIRAAENSPKIAAALKAAGIGATYGGVAGFGAGEGGFENRLENAAFQGAVGAPLGVAGYGAMRVGEYGLDKFMSDNKVANYLRKRLVQDRGDAYSKNPNMPRRPDGSVDVNDPRFANLAGDDLEQALARERGLSNRKSDVITADVMPGTTEAVLLRPGEQTAGLRRQIVKRHYDPDPNLPEDVALDQSHFGHLKKWFDRAFGRDNFRMTDDQLVQHLQQESARNFAPAHAMNIYSPEIEEVLGRIQGLSPELINEARKAAAFQRRGTENLNQAGDLMNYNTQYLHDIKRNIGQTIKANKNPITGGATFDEVPYIQAQKELNDAIKRANDPYRHAMERYGEEADVIDALRKGREEVFGKSPDQIDKGIGAEDIRAALSNPDWTDHMRDMYRLGGVRALRAHTLGSESKKFGHNWADVLNNPNIAEKYKALVDPAEAHLWPTMRDQMMQLSQRRKNLEGAMGNSKTMSRQQMVEELNDTNHLAEVVATGVNPHAPSTFRNWVRYALDPREEGRKTANRMADLMSGTGQVGNQNNVQSIRNLLARYQQRKSEWDAGKNRAAAFVPWAYPARQWEEQRNP